MAAVFVGDEFRPPDNKSIGLSLDARQELRRLRADKRSHGKVLPCPLWTGLSFSGLEPLSVLGIGGIGQGGTLTGAAARRSQPLALECGKVG